MSDYQKGKIYKLWSPSKNLVYYGSTVQTLSQRLAGHIVYYKNYEKTNHYYSSFKILECEDYKIELIEEYPCNNKQQLLKKEGEYIKANECVNKQIAGRTKKEYKIDTKEQKSKYDKIYQKINEERRKEQSSQYRKNNKDKLTQAKKKDYQEHREHYLELSKKYRETTKQNNAIYKWLLMTGIIV